MNLTADLESAFLDWGESEPATVGGQQVTVIFSNPTKRNSPDSTAVADDLPEIWVSSSDADGVRIDDGVIVRNQEFRIVDRINDGIGLVCFKLR